MRHLRSGGRVYLARNATEAVLRALEYSPVVLIEDYEPAAYMRGLLGA